jgi:glyoxylase-like metal-dependent hydrolase (beta-lactamase superfamily II)
VADPVPDTGTDRPLSESPELPVWPDALRPGNLVEVAPGVVRLVAPNPGIMTGPGTNTYLLGEDRLALIDPGPDDDAHLVALLEAVGDRLRWILVTHSHVDHSPLSARLQEVTGAQILAFGPAPGGRPVGLDAHDPAFVPDRLLLDGDRLECGELIVEAVYTPGHAANHLCFELAGTGLLFSGDHVMAGSTVVIGPPDGNMADYLASLEYVRRRAPRRIAPGHGDVIEDPAAVLDDYLRHRREREVQVLAGLRAAPEEGVTAEQLVAAIYVDISAALQRVAKYSVWAHLMKLAADGKATAAEPLDLDAPWRPAQAADDRLPG